MKYSHAPRSRAPSDAGQVDSLSAVFPRDNAMVARNAVCDLNLTAGEFRILTLLLLFDVPNKDVGCRLSQQQIANYIGQGYTTVKRALDKLQALGYIHPPIAEYLGGRRSGSDIRVTPKARSSGPHLEAAPSVLPPVADVALGLDGVNLTPSNLDTSNAAPSQGATPSLWVQPDPTTTGGTPPSDAIKTSGCNLGVVGVDDVPLSTERIFPSVPRETLWPDDLERLRKLDDWGCPNSEDWLATMFGMIAERDRRAGRLVERIRIREFYDGAAASRAVARADNPLGQLLRGIERGYLLTNRRKTDTMSVGARHTLQTYIERALAGAAIDSAQLRSLGVTLDAFSAMVDKQRSAAAAHGEVPADAPGLPLDDHGVNVTSPPEGSLPPNDDGVAQRMAELLAPYSVEQQNALLSTARAKCARTGVTDEHSAVFLGILRDVIAKGL